MLRAGGSRREHGALGMLRVRGQPYNVPFPCSGKSARSIIAESLRNEMGRGLSRHSTGSRPGGALNPFRRKWAFARSSLGFLCY